MNYSISCIDNQALILDKLKTAGAEVIQSSHGLVCKSDLSLEDLQKAIGKEPCKVEELVDVRNESPDIQKFINKNYDPK